MVKPEGCIVDIHPTETAALVQAGDRTTGWVEAGDAPMRHASAGAALSTAIEDGLFVIAAAVEFDFHTYGDTIEELRDYIEETWRSARIDDNTVDRTRDLLRTGAAGIRPRVRERVRLTILNPIARRG
jgi:hypothetical protein